MPEENVGPPADVWGLGATLYHAVAGRRPFSKPRSRRFRGARTALSPAHRGAQALAGGVPESLSRAIHACLQKHPDDRPTARELALMLEPAVADLPAKLVLGRRGARRA